MFIYVNVSAQILGCKLQNYHFDRLRNKLCVFRVVGGWGKKFATLCFHGDGELRS